MNPMSEKFRVINRLEGRNLVICINNEGNEVSLERWKIYQSIPDPEAERHEEIRVIDEEGETQKTGFPSLHAEAAAIGIRRCLANE